jgi:hypothetical protein
MILEIMTWGFFSAWGWFGANYIKEQIWSPEPPAVEKKVQSRDLKKDTDEQPNKQQTAGR